MAVDRIDRWVKGTRSEVGKLLRSKATKAAQRYAVELFRKESRYADLISKANWAGTERLATAELKALEANLEALTKRQREIVSVSRRRRALTAALRGSKPTKTTLPRDFDGLVHGLIEDLDALARTQLSAAMSSHLVLAAARFNTLLLSRKPPRSQPAAFLGQAARQLDAAKVTLLRALRTEDLSAARRTATGLSRLSTTLIGEALEEAAVSAFGRSKPTAPVGSLLRELFDADALGRYVAWIAGWPEEAAVTRQWLVEVKRLRTKAWSDWTSQRASLFASVPGRLKPGWSLVPGVANAARQFRLTYLLVAGKRV